MRVAMVGPFGLETRGTMRWRALPMAKALAARGHQVRMVLPPWDCPAASGRCWEEEGVEVVNIPLPPAFPLLRHLLIAARLLRHALKGSPQVVHCFKPKAYSGLVADLFRWGRRLGLMRAGLVMDSDDWEGPGGWNELRKDYSHAQRLFFAYQERKLMARCDVLIVASRALQTIAWSLGVARRRVFYIPNGPWRRRHTNAAGDPSLPEEWEDKPVVLLYSRLFEVELERLAQILSLVGNEIPEARFLWVGESLLGGGERLPQALERKGLGGRFHATGWVEGEALWGYLSRAQVALYPYEDNLVNRTKCSVKLLDLMAAGVPVVADDVGENREYLEDGVSGFLVRGGKPEDFAQKITELLRDENLRWRMGAVARRRVWERFDWRHLVREVEEAYQMAVGE